MRPALRIYTLGALQVYLQGELVESFDTDKVRALLAYLAVEKERPHRREILAGLLWSDQPEQRALHSLRQALSVLRKALGMKISGHSQLREDSLILAVRDSICLHPEINLWLDVKNFEELLGGAYRHYQRSNGSGRLNIRRLKQAAALYRGSFLNQFYLNGSPLFEEWAMLKRENIDQRMMEALSYLIDYHERRGELLLARQAAQRLAQLAPWEEGACSKMVRMLAMEGHWSAALAQAQKFVHYLSDDLGVDPSPEMKALIENTRQRALQPLPVAQQQHQHAKSLPVAETPFVGREAELDQLSDLLADPCCRLITLMGIGGIGKTRLAIEAASEQAGIFADGVFFAPLSGAHNLSELITALAGAVGFRFFEGGQPREQVLAYLGTKDMLLVLDNCEHLLLDMAEDNGVIPFLMDIIKGSERLKMLATSRTPFNLRMEHVIEVDSLLYPDLQNEARGETYSAIELFQQTAQRLLPKFSLEAEWAAVAEICRALEGVPLAIELSAAWVRAQSCADILREIQNDLDFLSTRMHDVPVRHRSLRAVFDHSWRLLSNQEQEILQRLSVFRGGFSVQAALVVAAAPAGLLASLAQKSLLQRTGPERFGVHSLIRQYAAEKLAANKDEARAAAQRHAKHYVDFLASLTHPLKSAGQQHALEEMALEMENWRPAWNWLADHGGAPEMDRCVEAIFHFYNIRAGFQDGMELLQKAAPGLENENAHPMTLGGILAFVGALAYRAHEDETCHKALEQARQILENGPADSGLAFCLVFWAAMMARKKEHAAAMQAVERSVELYRRLDDRWGEGYALYLQSLLLNRKGIISEAQITLQASLAAARQSGDLHRQIGPLNLLADLLCTAGDFDEAQQYFEESLRISRAIQDRFNEALIAQNLGTVYHLRQQYEQARQLYQESLKISVDIGDTTGQALALSNLGELASDCGEYPQALEIFRQGLVLSRSQGDDWVEVSCLNNLANTCLEIDDLPSAQAYINTALKLSNELDAPPTTGIALFHLARLRLRQAERQQAADFISVLLHIDGLDDYIRQKTLQVCQAAGLPVPQSATLSLSEALVLAGLES